MHDNHKNSHDGDADDNGNRTGKAGEAVITLELFGKGRGERRNGCKYNDGKHLPDLQGKRRTKVEKRGQRTCAEVTDKQGLSLIHI